MGSCDNRGRLTHPHSSHLIIFSVPHYIVVLSRLTIRIVLCFTACGGLRTNTRGFIDSPTSAMIQSGTTDCAWLIQGPVGSQIKVTSFAIVFVTISSVGDYRWICTKKVHQTAAISYMHWLQREAATPRCGWSSNKDDSVTTWYTLKKSCLVLLPMQEVGSPQ